MIDNSDQNQSIASDSNSNHRTRNKGSDQIQSTTDSNLNHTTTGTDASEWKTQTVPQDTSLIPSIAVFLWMGVNGIVLSTGIYAILFYNTNQRALFLTFCATALLGPREEGLNIKNSPYHSILFILLYLSYKNHAYLLSSMILSIILPPDFPPRISKMIGNWIMIQAGKYFGLTTTLEDEDALREESNSVIFAFEPHDVLPYAVFAFNPVLKRIPGKVGESQQCLMTSAIFHTPFLRNIYSWVCGAPITKAMFRKKLALGESFVFVPGGVQEVMLMNDEKPEELLLYLKKRKGFIKLALEQGASVVPVFCFNLAGSYKYYLPRGKLTESICRYIGFIPMIFIGRYGIPFWIPYPKKLHIIIGKPIHIPKEDHVRSSSVDQYHQIFLREMENLFERHKRAEGYNNIRVIIV